MFLSFIHNFTIPIVLLIKYKDANYLMDLRSEASSWSIRSQRMEWRLGTRRARGRPAPRWEEGWLAASGFLRDLPCSVSAQAAAILAALLPG